MRGIKTLALRMDRHCANAQQVAEFLARQPQVELIHYPGLPSFAQYELAQRQMRLPGGMIAFELKGGIEAGRRFMNALQLFARAVSLGDAESLAQHPASMTHSSYTAKERAHHGISEGWCACRWGWRTWRTCWRMSSRHCRPAARLPGLTSSWVNPLLQVRRSI